MNRKSIKKSLLGSATILAGCILISLLPGLLAFALDGDIIALERGVGFAFFVSAYFSLILVVWGLPLHAMLSHFKMKSIFAYLTIGFLAVPVVVVLFRPFGGTPFSQSIPLTAVLGVFGILTGAIFWFIAVREKDSD